MTRPRDIQGLLEALCAYIRFGSSTEAAAYLGIPDRALRSRLHRLRGYTGTRNTTHLAARMYPYLSDYYVIRHDEPHGTVEDIRRAA